MRRARLLLGLLVAATLGAATWLRDERPYVDPDPQVRLVKLPTSAARAGPFTLAGAWEVANPTKNFGGFSALLAMPDGSLRAGSDGGWWLDFATPDSGVLEGRLHWIGLAGTKDKQTVDLESLTAGPDGETIWGGYEMTNAIIRFGPRMERRGVVRRAEMADWGDNSGPEAFARFADGRFLAIEERETEWNSARHRAVLFDGDPVAGAQASMAIFVGIEGYRPVDMVAIGGGRALVLFRDLVFGFPPRFHTAIGLIDLDSLKKGGEIRTTLLATLDGRFPQDNYEGMALTGDAGDRQLWLISDDNRMQYQRTLVLKLRWDETPGIGGPERQKARE